MEPVHTSTKDPAGAIEQTPEEGSGNGDNEGSGDGGTSNQGSGDGGSDSDGIPILEKANRCKIW